IDPSGNLVADHARRLRRIGIDAEPGKDIGEVDAGSLDADPNFSGTRHRIGALSQGQDVRRPVARNDDLPHLVGGERNTPGVSSSSGPTRMRRASETTDKPAVRPGRMMSRVQADIRAGNDLRG